MGNFQDEFAKAFTTCAATGGIGIPLTYNNGPAFTVILYYPENTVLPIDMNQGRTKVIGADVLRTDFIANGLKVGFVLKDAAGVVYTITDIDMADASVPIGTLFLRTTGFPP